MLLLYSVCFNIEISVLKCVCKTYWKHQESPHINVNVILINWIKLFGKKITFILALLDFITTV